MRSLAMVRTINDRMRIADALHITGNIAKSVSGR
jgi:hypothetical protein